MTLTKSLGSSAFRLYGTRDFPSLLYNRFGFFIPLTFKSKSYIKLRDLPNKSLLFESVIYILLLISVDKKMFQ
jgi:hypothetical protein